MITVFHNQKFLDLGTCFDDDKFLQRFLIQTSENNEDELLIEAATVATDDLNKAFELTNNLTEDGWTANEGVTATMKSLRSTSVGDLMVRGDGETLLVAGLGFLPDPRPIMRCPEDELPTHLGKSGAIDRLVQRRLEQIERMKE